MDIAIMDSYMNLAGEIVYQARRDLVRYKTQKPNRNSAVNISPKEYRDTQIFLKSEYAKYLLNMVIEWKYLKDHLYTPKTVKTRQGVKNV